VIVDRSLTLRGAGAGSTIIDGSGNGRVIKVHGASASLTVSISRVRIQNGLAQRGAGISSVPPSGAKNLVMITRSVISGNKSAGTGGRAAGGGIYNGAGSSMSIATSTIHRNSATGAGDSCGPSGREGCDGSGGGIENAGTVKLMRTTVSGNSAVGGNGGAICTGFGGYGFPGGNAFGGGIAGGASLVNSTVSGNSATGGNAGIAFFCPGGTRGAGGDGSGGGIEAARAVTAVNTTVAGNSAVGGSGNPPGAATGGGIGVGTGSVMLTNSILAKNTATSGSDCDGSVSSGGHNLLGSDTSCSGFTGPGDLVNVNPMLGPLQENGGPTKTMARGAGSLAIDAGDDTVCTNPPVNGVDQRAYPRPGGPHCDIGSFEVQPA
jgi:hypothetical protein